MRTSTFSLPATSPRTSARWYSGFKSLRVGDGAELAEFGREWQPSATRWMNFSCFNAVADQVGHRDHLQAVALAELHQLRHPRHGAVVVHDFADHARRSEPGQARQVHRWPPSAPRAPARRLRARAAETRGPDAPGRPAGTPGPPPVRMVRVRSAAEIPVVTPSRASIDSQNAVPNIRRVGRAHQRQAQVVAALRGERQADQPAAVRGHEIDDLGRDLSAAMVRSPSFSRSSSSTTTSMRPARISSMASGTGTKGIIHCIRRDLICHPGCVARACRRVKMVAGP